MLKFSVLYRVGFHFSCAALEDAIEECNEEVWAQSIPLPNSRIVGKALKMCIYHYESDNVCVCVSVIMYPTPIPFFNIRQNSFKVMPLSPSKKVVSKNKP